MLTRYAGAIGTGLLITVALIYWMQYLISGQVDSLARPPTTVFVPRYHEIREPLRDPPVPPDPVDPPEPVTVPPELPTINPPTTHTAGPTAIDPPGTGLWPPFDGPGLPFGRGFGGGSATANGQLMAIAHVQPIYPYAAERRGLAGRVIVEFTVTAAGTVTDARIIESTHEVFERAALTAVARFRYRPRTIDGVAVAVAGVRTEFDFHLDD